MTLISTPEVESSTFGMLDELGRYLWECCI